MTVGDLLGLREEAEKRIAPVAARLDALTPEIVKLTQAVQELTKVIKDSEKKIK